MRYLVHIDSMESDYNKYKIDSAGFPGLYFVWWVIIMMNSEQYKEKVIILIGDYIVQIYYTIILIYLFILL